MTRRRRLLALLAAALILPACGRQGDLRLPDRSPPLALPPDIDADEDAGT